MTRTKVQRNKPLNGLFEKTLILSFLTYASLHANEVNIATLNVESTLITEVAQNAQTSADVAQALNDSVPSIDISRRSGIANDILIRGQKRDNISVEVDGTKVYGACPNRMDPPVSHIVANQIETIEVIEGPFDVETFGTMSGGIKITTKQPTKELKGQINLGVGSFNYKKVGATLSGGTDVIRLSVTLSTESSNQYKDGDGNTIAQQVDNYAGTNPLLQGVKYKPEYKDLQAYSKKSAMVKAFVTTAKNQELRLSYTGNRSDNILYGNSKMDALWDDSNIYSVAYNIDKLSDTYQNLNLQYYKSDADHPMATKYRLSSNNAMMDNTNHLTTQMQGLKLKNTFILGSHKILFGLDGSERLWDGRYYNTTTGDALTAGNSKSIDNAITNNVALFTKINNTYGDFDVSVAARYDTTNISHATQQSNNYSALNANVFTTYNLNKDNKLFVGIGQASRVPDARELYFVSSNGSVIGTPNLKQTTNTEIDLGYEVDSDDFKFKIKVFYSDLKDYIYIKKGASLNAFQNIDATVYGTEISGSYYVTDDATIDFGVSYKHGQKAQALESQTDTNLADMAPLRGNIALNYEYMNNSIATIELKASDKWSEYDSDNGEQELAAWSILNMKVKHAINKKFDFTLGVNNLLDSTYAMSNTYVDLTLITAGTDDVMLMNEPGRYIYTNLDFKF
ncbi:MAG: TonB-dependent receptor [Sulfurimonas sp.]|nr:TonB-dependent receptor [Sulfurimonas sp.]